MAGQGYPRPKLKCMHMLLIDIAASKPWRQIRSFGYIGK